MDKLIGILNAEGQLEGALHAQTPLQGTLCTNTVVINGRTPIKGVDYFTEQDISEITECIVAQVGIVRRNSYLEFPNIGNEHAIYLDTATHKYYYWSNEPLGYHVAGMDYTEIEIINGGNAYVH